MNESPSPEVPGRYRRDTMDLQQEAELLTRSQVELGPEHQAARERQNDPNALIPVVIIGVIIGINLTWPIIITPLTSISLAKYWRNALLETDGVSMSALITLVTIVMVTTFNALFATSITIYSIKRLAIPVLAQATTAKIDEKWVPWWFNVVAGTVILFGLPDCRTSAQMKRLIVYLDLDDLSYTGALRNMWTACKHRGEILKGAMGGWPAFRRQFNKIWLASQRRNE